MGWWEVIKRRSRIYNSGPQSGATEDGWDIHGRPARPTRRRAQSGKNVKQVMKLLEGHGQAGEASVCLGEFGWRATEPRMTLTEVGATLGSDARNGCGRSTKGGALPSAGRRGWRYERCPVFVTMVIPGGKDHCLGNQ